MEKIEVQDLVLKVSRRWDAQYPPTSAQTAEDKIEVGNKLRKLPLDATANDVEAIIGNDTWAKLECEACGSNVQKVVCVDSEYGSSSLNLCEKCLERALRVLQG